MASPSTGSSPEEDHSFADDDISLEDHEGVSDDSDASPIPESRENSADIIDDDDDDSGDDDDEIIEESPDGSPDDSIEYGASSDAGYDDDDQGDLDAADGGISSRSSGMDLDEILMHAFANDIPGISIPANVDAATRAHIIAEMSRRSPAAVGEAGPSASASPASATPSQSERGRAAPSVSQHAGSKRRHSEAEDADAEAAESSSAAATTAAAAAGGAHGQLPPISSLLDSIGGSSSSSSSSSRRSGQPSQTRPRTSPKRPRRNEPVVVEDLFGSDDDAGVEVVNLIDVDRPDAAQDADDDDVAADTKQEPEPEQEQEAAPEPAPKTPADSLVKFSGLQCVICMDDITMLTVTHCGHLFCGECLHSSLVMSHDRKICPICRTKLEMRVTGMAASKMARSYFPLVVKVRSANKQGKQPMPPS